MDVNDIYELGYCYYSNGDYEKAIANFNKVINLDDSLAQNANYHLAACFIKTGNKSSARNAFQLASKKDFNPKIKNAATYDAAFLILVFVMNSTSRIKRLAMTA